MTATGRWRVRSKGNRVAIVVAACAALSAAVQAAPAAGAPVYRDPAGYKGVRKAPKTKAAPAPRPPAPVTLSAAGTFPNVLVDEAGTAHVVWNEDRGDAADVVVYCRLKRGATACDSRTELRWDKAYGAGDDPRYNVGGPPKIVRVGGQLVVFSHRYPTMAEKPDGASSSTVVAWASGDGGTSWPPVPAIVGKWNVGSMAVIGPEDDPTILNVEFDPLCTAAGQSGMCIEAYKSGRYSGDAGNLSTGANQNYNIGVTLDEEGRSVTTTEDLAYNTFVRRWTGAGSPLDPATWTAPAVIPTDQSVIAGGPAGVFLMGKPPSGYGAYAVRRLDRTGDGYAPGAATAISDATGNTLGTLFQGPGGRLHAAWQQTGKGLLQRSTASAAGAKPAFAKAQTLTDGDGNGQISIGAAADGGGFTAYNHTGGILSEGQIAIAGFGNQIPTGRPGIADVPGGGLKPGGAGTEGKCSQLSFGSFVAESTAGCLLKGTGSRAQEYVTGGELNIWGVRIIPEAGAKIIIDPRSLQLDTTGSVRVVVSAPPPVGDVVLFRGEIHRDLSKVVPGTNLFEFPTGLFKANVLGFDVGANINVRLERDGVHIPVDLRLPPAFGGFAGHAELVADRKGGLHLDSLKIHIGPVPLGVLIVNRIDLEYQGAGDRWSGRGSITVPAGGTLDVSAEFAMGDFKRATLLFKPGTPITIGPFVYLLQFGGGFGVEPVQIDANATIGAGVAVQNESPVKVRGDFKMTFPTRGPADFRLTGTLSVFFLDVADGSLVFQTDGYAAFAGHAGVHAGPLTVDAKIDGFVDAPTGQYGSSLDGKVDLCVSIPVDICAGARAGAAVSSKGFAACARFNPPDPVGGFEAGISYPWSDWNPVYLTNPAAFAASLVTHIGGCHVEDYRVASTRARAAQAAGAPVVLPAGLPEATILVRGDGGRPRIAVTGPGGESFSSDTPSAAGFVMTVPGVDAAYVMLRRPRAGTWTISSLPGSAPVSQILTAKGYEPARVTARLGGRGRARTVKYKIASGGHGQTVTLQERGRFGTHVLGAAKGARGTLRFRPADAAGGRRTVVALIGRGGRTTDEVKVGSYVAPGPVRPGAVSRVRAKRSTTTMTVSWRGARGATRYAVELRGAKGTRIGRLVPARTRSVRFRAVRRDERIQVSVRAISKRLRSGPARRISSRGDRR